MVSSVLATQSEARGTDWHTTVTLGPGKLQVDTWARAVPVTLASSATSDCILVTVNTEQIGRLAAGYY